MEPNRIPMSEAEAENQLPQDFDSKRIRNALGVDPRDAVHARGADELGA